MHFNVHRCLVGHIMMRVVFRFVQWMYVLEEFVLDSPQRSVVFLPFKFRNFAMSTPRPRFQFFRVGEDGTRVSRPFSLLLLRMASRALDERGVKGRIPIHGLPPLTITLTLFRIVFRPVPFSGGVVLVVSPNCPYRGLNPMPFISPQLGTLLGDGTFLVRHSMCRRNVNARVYFQFPQLYYLRVHFYTYNNLEVSTTANRGRAGRGWCPLARIFILSHIYIIV